MRWCDRIRHIQNSYACFFTFRWDFLMVFKLIVLLSVGRSTFLTVVSWMAYFPYKQCTCICICICISIVFLLDCDHRKFALFTFVSNRYPKAIARGQFTARNNFVYLFWVHWVTNQVQLCSFVSICSTSYLKFYFVYKWINLFNSEHFFYINFLWWFSQFIIVSAIITRLSECFRLQCPPMWVKSAVWWIEIRTIMIINNQKIKIKNFSKIESTTLYISNIFNWIKRFFLLSFSVFFLLHSFRFDVAKWLHTNQK